MPPRHSCSEINKMGKVEKNNEEMPVPFVWRDTLCNIVDNFKFGNFNIENLMNVDPLKIEDIKLIRDSIKYYGDKLISLSDKTWGTSICRWMIDHWQVMIDLSTLREEQSDLVLFVKVNEENGHYRFKVQSLHVP